MSKPPPEDPVSTGMSASQHPPSCSCTVPSSELSLDGVPDLYIISQLHRFAGNYWNKPETADCTIVVPKDIMASYQDSDDHKSVQKNLGGSAESGPQNDRSRRPKQQNASTKMVFKLHQQYLSVQSTLLRSVLQSTQSGLPNRVNDGSQLCSQFGSLPSGSPRPLIANRAPTSSSIRPPYILPSSRANHPIIYIPVPDPVSIPHLIYYLYFGTFDHIEDSLHKGTMTWQGIVRNVEYLGMRVEIKAALGRYHRVWMKPTSTPPVPNSEQETGKDDSSESGDSEGAPQSNIESPSGQDRKRV